MKKLLAVLLCVMLSACATYGGHPTQYPLPNEADLEPFAKAVTEVKDDDGKPKKNTDGTPMKRKATMANIRAALDAYMESVVRSKTGKAQNDWAISEATFVGALMAVVGGLADKTGLLNTGAGVAALGVAASDRYKLNKQTEAYKNAYQRLKCISTGFVQVDDEVLKEVEGISADPDLMKAVAAAPVAVIASVDTVKDMLQNALDGLSPTLVDRNVLDGYFKQFAQQTKVAPDVQAGIQEVAQKKTAGLMRATDADKARAELAERAETGRLAELVVLVQSVPTAVGACTLSK